MYQSPTWALTYLPRRLTDARTSVSVRPDLICLGGSSNEISISGAHNQSSWQIGDNVVQIIRSIATNKSGDNNRPMTSPYVLLQVCGDGYP